MTDTLNPPAAAEVAEIVSRVIRERRTNLNVDPDRPVPPELIEQLIELACWAPNHKRTNPWRFAVLTGAGRARLGDLAAEGQRERGDPPSKVDKTRVKYLRSPVVLAVGAAVHDDPVLHRENRDAVAAGVQNILLAATALGLASYWGTGATVDEPAVKELVGLGPRDELIALIYLGWPTKLCPPGQRDAPVVRWID